MAKDINKGLEAGGLADWREGCSSLLSTVW